DRERRARRRGPRRIRSRDRFRRGDPRGSRGAARLSAARRRTSVRRRAGLNAPVRLCIMCPTVGIAGVRRHGSASMHAGRLLMLGGSMRAVARAGVSDTLRIAFVTDTFDGAVSGGTRSAVRFVDALRAHIPVVAAFHVQPENLLLNVGLRSRPISDAMYRFWVRRLYNRADAVVCPSPFAEDKLRSHGLTAPAFVVSNGISPAIRRRRLPREPHHEGAFVVLMVGRLAPEKRHDLMFEALARAKHRDRIRLVVAGAGPRERQLRRAAARLPHPPEIGFVSDRRLERLYNTADLLV